LGGGFLPSWRIPSDSCQNAGERVWVCRMMITFRKSSAHGLTVAAVLVSALCVGCHPWYLAESVYRQKGRMNRPPDVTATSSYRAIQVKGATVAIQAPDECADRTAAAGQGEAVPARELIHKTCGVEMAELERALARAGQRVISWSAVREKVRYQQVTPLVAARSLGADILLQVNSLEHTVIVPGYDTSWRRRFYESDKHGIRGPEATVPEARLRTLEREMRTVELEIFPRGKVSATINATVVSVSSGEAIWFYEWTQGEAFEQEVFARQLFECNRKHLHTCFRRTLPADRTLVGPGGDFIAVDPESAGETEAAYYALVKRIVADLVSRLTNQPAE